jgi:hypothetical protein
VFVLLVRYYLQYTNTPIHQLKKFFWLGIVGVLYFGGLEIEPGATPRLQREP